MALTGKNMPYKHSFGPFASEDLPVPASYPLRDGLRPDRRRSAKAIQKVEFEIGAENVAAVMIEPIQGEGGFIVPAPGFLPGVAQWCTDNGAIFIADEVQTGFCRTGEWFAVDHEVWSPTMTTARASPAACRWRLSPVVRRSWTASTWVVLAGRTAGNPVACAAAMGSIATMEELDLAGRAREIGAIMMDKLAALAEQYDVIAEVRGRGAMVAIEFAKPGTLEPLPDLPKAMAARCAQEGVVILTAGTFGTSSACFRRWSSVTNCSQRVWTCSRRTGRRGGRVSVTPSGWQANRGPVRSCTRCSTVRSTARWWDHAEPSAADVDEAVQAAVDVQSAALATTAAQRADALMHVSQQITARAEEIAQLITAENGKPLMWSRIEGDRGASTFRWAAEEAWRWSGVAAPRHRCHVRGPDGGHSPLPQRARCWASRRSTSRSTSSRCARSHRLWRSVP